MKTLKKFYIYNADIRMYFLAPGEGMTRLKSEAHLVEDIVVPDFSDRPELHVIYEDHTGPLPTYVGTEGTYEVEEVKNSSSMIEVLEAALAWIDAVPKDTELPTMPGFDRDWADLVLYEAKVLNDDY
jgi:hypothetical protein